MKGCWILLSDLSESIEMTMFFCCFFLSFILLRWYITLIGFQMLNQPCIPEIIPFGHDVSFLFFLKYLAGFYVLVFC